MKYIFILLVAVMLIGVGSIGGYFFFKQSAEASYGDASQEDIDKKEAAKKAAMSAEERAKNLRFVKLDPIILPIIDETGVTQVVTLVVSLEVDGDENAEYAQSLTPRLKDAFIQDMYGVLNRKASMEGGMVKVNQLKARLNRLSSNVLGEDKVNDVLLQVVNQRPI
jgi:flagellar FliL protein